MKNNFSTKLFFAICMALIPFFSSCNKDSENNGNAKGNGECYVDGKASNTNMPTYPKAATMNTPFT